MTGKRDSVLQVVAAAVVNAAGEVLVARRPQHLHQGGLWEFPGGKVETGETPHAALVRELGEELGITVTEARPLIKVQHAYPDREVLLDVWRVNEFQGEPHGREGQAIAWMTPEDLPQLAFPAANRPIVTAARLPSVYLVTPEPEDVPSFLNRLEALLGTGIALVQLRAKTLDEAAYTKLAEQVARLCEQAEVRLLLNTAPARARELGVGGVHLTAQRLMTLSERPLPADCWVAASCHNEIELAQACRIGVDFVVAAPVLATASHPDARPLGWEALRGLTDQATVPVYALGGMKESHLPAAWEHGAQGIAAISSLWEKSSN